MQRDLIKNIQARGEEGQAVTVAGWIKTKRESKAFSFIIINDGSSQADLQIIADSGIPGSEDLNQAGTGASIRVEGTLKRSQGKGQSLELVASQIIVLGSADASYPLQKKGHTLEFLREIAHLRGRTNTFGAVYRVRNTLSYLVHRFFQERNFLWAHTPIITANDCEGAGELFQVTTLDLKNMPKNKENGEIDFSQDFFKEKAHLTVSGQLEGEFLALGLGNIYTFGPTFRAENSNTTRHLAEFWMIEPEMAFADLQDDMNLAEDFFRYLCAGVIKENPDEINFLAKHYGESSLENLQKLSQTPFARITYTEAIEELKKSGHKFEFPIDWGTDMQSEHERFLTEKIFKSPVIVTDYPKNIKAFYMKVNSDERTVAAMDVLVPGVGELIGGSQREDRLDILVQRMKEMGIQPEKLEWYLDLRRFGSCPHAGFGLGFERLVQYITGIGNIRDTIPCPRAPGLIGF